MTLLWLVVPFFFTFTVGVVFGMWLVAWTYQPSDPRGPPIDR